MNSYENVIVDNLFVYFKHFLKDLILTIGKGSKTPVTENVRDGGVPPFSVIFFR